MGGGEGGSCAWAFREEQGSWAKQAVAKGTGAQRGGQPSRSGKVPSGEAEGVGAESAESLVECYHAPEGGKWFPAVGKGRG